MKNRSYLSLLLISVVIWLMAFQSRDAEARDEGWLKPELQSFGSQLAGSMQAVEATPTTYESETPNPRELPGFGGNAGLVIGASVLVLIIIGGVIFSSRKKAKH